MNRLSSVSKKSGAVHRLSIAEMTAVAQAKSDAEKHSLLSSYDAQRSQVDQSTLLEFNQKYKMKAVWSHNELLLRSPAVKPDRKVHYEDIINDFDIEAIAEDLEHLARELH